MISGNKVQETKMMKHSVLFQGMVCALLVCSAVYIRYRVNAEKDSCVQTAACGEKAPYCAELTLTDLAENVYGSVVGTSAR